MSLLRAQLRGLIATEMRRLGVAAGNVVENRALPTAVAQLPIVVLTTPLETKVSRGPGAPQFNTTMGIAADVRVSGNTDDALDLLEAVIEQVELAVLSNATVMSLVQNAAGVESACSLSVENGTPVASGRVMFHLVLPQVYNPALLQQLDQVQITVGENGTTSDVTVSLEIPPTPAV